MLKWKRNVSSEDLVMFNSTLKIAGSIALVVMFLQACATARTCYNDACYDRKIASVENAEVAAWGSEKEIYEQEKAEQKMRHQDHKGH
jgi:hypothetical protein